MYKYKCKIESVSCNTKFLSYCLYLQDTEDRGCIPCPSGQYIDANTTACTPCVPDTTVTDPLAYGIDSCQPCGPGLTSFDGVTCTTKCVFSLDGVQYDFRALAEYAK